MRWCGVGLSWLLEEEIYVRIFHARIERHGVFSDGVKGSAMGGHHGNGDGVVIKEAAR